MHSLTFVKRKVNLNNYAWWLSQAVQANKDPEIGVASLPGGVGRIGMLGCMKYRSHSMKSKPAWCAMHRILWHVMYRVVFCQSLIPHHSNPDHLGPPAHSSFRPLTSRPSYSCSPLKEQEQEKGKWSGVQQNREGINETHLWLHAWRECLSTLNSFFYYAIFENGRQTAKQEGNSRAVLECWISVWGSCDSWEYRLGWCWYCWLTYLIFLLFFGRKGYPTNKSLVQRKEIGSVDWRVGDSTSSYHTYISNNPI